MKEAVSSQTKKLLEKHYSIVAKLQEDAVTCLNGLDAVKKLENAIADNLSRLSPADLVEYGRKLHEHHIKTIEFSYKVLGTLAYNEIEKFRGLISCYDYLTVEEQAIIQKMCGMANERKQQAT